MPDSHVRPRPSDAAAGAPAKQAQGAAAPDGVEQQPHGGSSSVGSGIQPALACGVGVLDGDAGARSRCARENGASARCECGQHTFLLPSPSSRAASSAAAPQHQQQQHQQHQQQQHQQQQDENRPPPARAPSTAARQAQARAVGPVTEDIENISRSMVQAMARGDSNSCEEGAGPGASSEGQQQQQQQQGQAQQQQAQQHGKRPSLLSGSGLGGSSSGAGGELPLDRIVVEPNGDMVLVEPSVVCDACPACDDVCALAACRGCAEKRARLLARGDMCLLDAQGRRLIRESSASGGGSGPAGCVPRIGKPRTPSSGAAASGAGASAGSACYTLCEVRRHRTLASCWLVAKGQVYDATRYLSSHPAGAIAIARKAGGVDCSEDLEFHSGRAQKLWRHLRIGVVVACPSEALKPQHQHQQPHAARTQASTSSSSGKSGSGAASRGRPGPTRARSSSFGHGGDGSLVGSSCSIM